MDNIKKNYSFWITRYSLIQIGSYCVSILSYVFYLLPILNNDLVLYSYLISNISNLRLRIYLNDVIAFIPQEGMDNSLLPKKLIIYINIFLLNIFIYLYIAKLGLLETLIITIIFTAGIYIGYLNNVNLHSMLRENLISKKNLFLFGFFPRLISTIILIIYVLVVGTYNSTEGLMLIKLSLISGMYLFPSLIYRMYFINKLTLKKALKRFEIKLINFSHNLNLVRYKEKFLTSNLNLFLLLIMNILFFIIMIKLNLINEGNIFKLPISITLILNLLLLTSRVKTAHKYYFNNREQSSNRKKFLKYLPYSCIIIFILVIHNNNFYFLYSLALIASIITIVTLHFEKGIILEKILPIASNNE